jgi:hypothetical protein
VNTFFFGHISLNVPKAFQTLRRAIRKNSASEIVFCYSPQCSIRLRSENRELEYDGVLEMEPQGCYQNIIIVRIVNHRSF